MNAMTPAQLRVLASVAHLYFPTSVDPVVTSVEVLDGLVLVNLSDESTISIRPDLHVSTHAFGSTRSHLGDAVHDIALEVLTRAAQAELARGAA